jgi:hypothetical protein
MTCRESGRVHLIHGYLAAGSTTFGHRPLRAQLADLSPAIAARGADVVLDFGFWSRADRYRTRQRANGVGAGALLYSVACDESLALERLTARNADPAGCFVLDQRAYEHLRRKFENVSAGEPYLAIGSEGSP